MDINEILAKIERGEELSKDERVVHQDWKENELRMRPSPQGHHWRVSGEPSRPPDLKDVAYGPHERNKLDLWLAEAQAPAPLVMLFYGGGFRAGEKTLAFALRPLCLKAGFAVACANYRHSQHAIYPASMQDGARALQFLRHHAAEWKIDPQRVACCGNSAGAGISLWLALRPDMADPQSSDPIARQSTRLKCAITYSGQTSYDIRFIRRAIRGPAYLSSALQDLFGLTPDQLDDPPPEKARLMEDASSINFVSADSPPVYLIYPRPNVPSTPETNQGDGIHHPTFGRLLKEKMDALNRECLLRCMGDDLSRFPTEMEFLARHLKAT